MKTYCNLPTLEDFCFKKIYVYYRARLGFIKRETIFCYCPSSTYLKNCVLALLKEHNCELAEVFAYSSDIDNYKFETILHLYN